MTLKIILKGGPDSGHHGHAGRPGSVGGSVAGSVAVSLRTGRAAAAKRGIKPEEKKWGKDEALHEGGENIFMAIATTIDADAVADAKEWADDIEVEFDFDQLKSDRSIVPQSIAIIASESGLSERLVRSYRGDWNVNTLKKKALFLQVEAKTRSGGTYEDHHESVMRGQTSSPNTRKIYAATYAHTQDILKNAGIKTMTVYRGVRAKNLGDQLGGDAGTGQVKNAPLSSWTSSPKNASNFARSGGAVIRMTIPASRIFSTGLTGIGSHSLLEIVVQSDGIAEEVMYEGVN